MQLSVSRNTCDAIPGVNAKCSIEAKARTEHPFGVRKLFQSNQFKSARKTHRLSTHKLNMRSIPTGNFLPPEQDNWTCIKKTSPKWENDLPNRRTHLMAWFRVENRRCWYLHTIESSASVCVRLQSPRCEIIHVLSIPAKSRLTLFSLANASAAAVWSLVVSLHQTHHIMAWQTRPAQTIAHGIRFDSNIWAHETNRFVPSHLDAPCHDLENVSYAQSGLVKQSWSRFLYIPCQIQPQRNAGQETARGRRCTKHFREQRMLDSTWVIMHKAF